MSTYITKRADELGLKVVDAKDPLTIEVTRKQIDKSQAKNSKACAFSRACEEKLPGVNAAFFFKTTAWLEYDDKIVRYLLPPSMQKEIVAFDRNKTMEPGTYRLAAINPNKTLVAQAKRRNAEKKTPRSHQSTGQRRRTKKFQHRTTNVRDLFDPSYRAAK